MKYSKTDMSEKDIEEKEIMERADKIIERLLKALYLEKEGDAIDYPTLMCALGKFTASVLLAAQEYGKILDVEEDFMKVVKQFKASMGKGMKMQKVQEERDQIKLRIEENERKIKELEQKRDELLLRMPEQYKGKLN
jgi:hypothetical protein